MVMKIKEMEYLISNKIINYEDSVKAMENRVEDISSKKKPELLWFLEHPPIYTAGTSSIDSDLLKKNTLPVYRTSRGGEYTYHGPGQRIIYIMLNLRERNYDIRKFVNTLESWIVHSLDDIGVKSQLINGKVGVWINNNDQPEKKIASIGLRISKGRSYHGISLNVDMDLTPFSLINPCGYKGLEVTQISRFDSNVTLEDVKSVAINEMKTLLN